MKSILQLSLVLAILVCGAIFLLFLVGALSSGGAVSLLLKSLATILIIGLSSAAIQLITSRNK